MDEKRVSLKPILTAHLFSKLEGLLIELLRSLNAEEWNAQTPAPKWNVKDVAAHLLDTQLRKLSVCRDGYRPQIPGVESDADLVRLINRLNAEGVEIYRRLSAKVLISLMEPASRQNSEYHESLDPFAPSPFAVSWAGEVESANWFDTAREFTERWHHQQQIRMAVDRPGIMTPEFYHPVLDCFMRAMPHHYRNVRAVPGARVDVNISGECGGSWHLYRSAGSWELVAAPAGETIAGITIPQEIAWRIFTKGIDPSSAGAQVCVTGSTEIGRHILEMTAVVG